MAEHTDEEIKAMDELAQKYLRAFTKEVMEKDLCVSCTTHILTYTAVLNMLANYGGVKTALALSAMLDKAQHDIREDLFDIEEIKIPLDKG